VTSCKNRAEHDSTDGAELQPTGRRHIKSGNAFGVTNCGECELDRLAS